jgi:hypothetical protein
MTLVRKVCGRLAGEIRRDHYLRTGRRLRSDRVLQQLSRIDGPYRVFTMPDKSLLAIALDPFSVKVDITGEPWPWLFVAKDRESYEAVMAMPVSPVDLLDDGCLAVRLVEDETQARKAA